MAAKIKDGLFIGDAETSQDPEFLELNKINNLINFSGREVSNVWAAHGLVYNTYNWEDREDFKLFDAKHEILQEIVLFVDKAIRHGASVLLFSTRGIGRCTAAVCAYLMFKYGWGFEKSYDFVYSKKPDIELNRGFVEQLFTLDKKLRQKRYQGREGSDLTQIEHKRIHEWDPTYVLPQALEEQAIIDGKNSNSKKSLIAPHVIPDTTSLDELLMIHSYVNSKMTISALPGPYEDALRQPKQFVLQINLANNQEAGIHLRRSTPPPLNTIPPRGGILKGGPNNFRVLQNSNHRSKQQKNQHNQQQHNQQHKQTMRDLEEDESSSLSDSEPATQTNNSRMNSYSQQNASIDTISLHVPSQTSQASDLYDFVGLTQQQQQQHHRNNNNNNNSQSQVDRSHDSKRGPSAEERLHNLLGDLQKGDRNRGNSNTAEPKGVRTSIDRDYKQLSSKQTSTSTLTPSSSSNSIPSTIHDLASMNIQPSYQPPNSNTSRTRTYTGQNSTQAGSQPIKSSTQVSIQRDKGESKEKYQAWTDRERDTDDGRDMTPSSAYYNHTGKAKTRSTGDRPGAPSSAKKSSSNGSTPTQSYRHGSPAPQVSRGGLASRSNVSSSIQKDRDDGSIDDRDNRSINSSGSRTRGTTPTRSNPTSSSSSTAQRSNTPLRQRGASPSVRDREKGATISGNQGNGSIGVSPRESDDGSNRRLSATQRETNTSGRSSTPLRERPESRERGSTNGQTNTNTTTNTTTSRSGTPSRGIRTDGTSGGRSSSPWLNNTTSSTDRDSNSGYRGWKY